MQLTKGAIGNLINRYKAVLKKCHLLNVFGSLAVAGMLVMGGAAAAEAGTWTKPNGSVGEWSNGVVDNNTELNGTYDGFTHARWCGDCGLHHHRSVCRQRDDLH